MKDLKNYIVEKNIGEIVSSEKYDQAINYAKDIYEEMKDVLPKLNNEWQKYFNDETKYPEPFSNEKEYSEYYRECNYSKNDVIGYKTYYGWEYGFYSTGFCFNDKEDMIKDMNELILKYNHKGKHSFSPFSILFSTCCDLIDTKYNLGGPMFQWKIKDFRMVDLAMQIAFRKIIWENK